jgi:thioredoxin-related protein
MKGLFNVLIFLAVTSHSLAEYRIRADSATEGIRFEQGLNWKQVLAKAKAENKYVFVDCYTTWCAPCKKMEKEVYSVPEVGAFYNAKFISVKIQMDSGKNDNDVIKSAYPDARYFEAHFKISVYPALLFFTPEGNILNSTAGAMELQDFIRLGNDVIDPKKNYYSLLARYMKGERNIAEMSYLARTTLQLLKDTARSEDIARVYMLNLKEGDLLTRENIEFMQGFTRSSKDMGFSLLYKNTDSINKIMGEDRYVQTFLTNIIFKENVLPVVESAVKSGSVPDWTQLGVIIQKKYNSFYSDAVIIAVKVDWYRIHKNWPEYTKYLVIYVEKYVMISKNRGHWPAFTLNNFAWDIFTYSHNKEELNKALLWSSRAVMMDPTANWMDTYANLLYKLGQDELAIKWEEIASKLAPNYKDIQIAMEKMKKKEPTWILQ